MKRFLVFTIITFMMTTLITACSDTKLEAETNNVSEIEEMPEILDNMNSGNTEVDKEPSYYGTWEITACAGTAVAYALSQEEINDYIEKQIQIFYTEDTFIYNGFAMDVPQNGYVEEIYTEADLVNDFNVTASDLGITENEILSVYILIEGEFFGSQFYVIDDNSLLVYYEGVFFLAKRVE